MTKKVKKERKRLVLIDGFAILHRAYHALPPLTNRSGELLNAVYGFCTMLFKVINDLKPAYLAVCLDTPKPTFRQMEYVGYQAQRPKMDEELSGQLGRVDEFLQAVGIPVYRREGYEADDVIGTLVKQALQLSVFGHRLSDKGKSVSQSIGGEDRQTGKQKNQNLKTENREPITEVIIVTGDRDIFQLVGPKVKVFAPVKGLSEAVLFDERGVEEKMGVRPDQIIDYKGLVGDSSDNYPGVPGIGPKTAALLLKRFGTLENIYKNLSSVEKERGVIVSDKLLEGKELAFLSKKLATIVSEVPLGVDFGVMVFDFSAAARARTIVKLKELGFKSLVERLEGREEKRDKDKEKEGEQLGLI